MKVLPSRRRAAAAREEVGLATAQSLIAAVAEHLAERLVHVDHAVVAEDQDRLERGLGEEAEALAVLAPLAALPPDGDHRAHPGGDELPEAPVVGAEPLRPRR